MDYFSSGPQTYFSGPIRHMIQDAKMVKDTGNLRNTNQAAPGALAHCLQRRTTCKIQNGRQGLETCLPPEHQMLNDWNANRSCQL